MIVSSHDTVVSCHDTVVSSCAVIAEYVKGGMQIRSSTVVNSIILRCELDLPSLTKRIYNGGIMEA